MPQSRSKTVKFRQEQLNWIPYIGETALLHTHAHTRAYFANWRFCQHEKVIKDGISMETNFKIQLINDQYIKNIIYTPRGLPLRAITGPTVNGDCIASTMDSSASSSLSPGLGRYLFRGGNRLEENLGFRMAAVGEDSCCWWWWSAIAEELFTYTWSGSVGNTRDWFWVSGELTPDFRFEPRFDLVELPTLCGAVTYLWLTKV